jgi:hypothetical protein
MTWYHYWHEYIITTETHTGVRPNNRTTTGFRISDAL